MKKIFLFLLWSTSYFMSAQIIDSTAIKQVDSLIQVSKELTAKNEYDKALELNSTAEKLAFENFGKESAVYANTCFNKGRVYENKADYLQAEKWYLEALGIRGKVLGKENADYPNCLNKLAYIYERMGNEKAEPTYLEAKEIQRKVLGTEHQGYANTLNNLAIFYKNRGNYEKAEPLYLEAKEIRKKALGVEHPNYASSLNNLGSLYMEMGNYLKAEPLYLEAKEIRKKALGVEHPDYAASLNNLAILYNVMGNYEKAELLYLEAKEIRKKVLGIEHPEYANSLNNLGVFYSDVGNYEKAEPLYLEAKEIRKKVLGIEHIDYAGSLNNLAELYRVMDNYEKAEPLYLEAKEIRKKVLGIDHPEYANSLNNLANLYWEMGNYEKAEPLYLEAKEIQKKVLGIEHPEYAMCLNNLAALYHNMGNYEKAEPLYLEVKEIRKKVLGIEHPDYAICLNNLAHLCAKTKRFAEAEMFLKQLTSLDQVRLLNATAFLSEQELSKYNAIFEGSSNNVASFAFARHNTDPSLAAGLLPALIFDQSLFYKGFLLQAANKLHGLISLTPKSQEINLQLADCRRSLAAEYSKPIAERGNVSELEEKANTAEKELMRMISGYAETSKQVNSQQVQKTLKLNEVAIEFIHFNVNFPKSSDSIMYAALLLKPGLQLPIFIPLFEEKSLDSILQSKGERRLEYVNDLYTFSSRGISAIQERRSLSELIFKPLEKDLTGIRTIYYSPSGLLHRINLDAIAVSENETLADRYNLVELNSTRQLVIPAVVTNTTNDAVLFGGIKYDMDTTIWTSQPLFASRSESQLSFSQTNPQSRGASWDFLPGTEREVNAIEKIMISSGIKTTLKKEYEASEEAFKSIGANNTPSPRILHIATHGYFFPDPDRLISAKSGVTHDNASNEGTAKAANTDLNYNLDNEPVFKISDHPMLRSGLIMAGGNNTWKGEKTMEGREDGVLTAYEISQMNLSNTELVVLSACETGLGTIQGNEGVYGLQRAFKIAGAKYLIMSLWQVPDKQTSLLMTTFYKKWLENKMTIPDAFHAAQKDLREAGLDPYYWAGFVLVE